MRDKTSPARSTLEDNGRNLSPVEDRETCIAKLDPAMFE